MVPLWPRYNSTMAPLWPRHSPVMTPAIFACMTASFARTLGRSILSAVLTVAVPIWSQFVVSVAISIVAAHLFMFSSTIEVESREYTFLSERLWSDSSVTGTKLSLESRSLLVSLRSKNIVEECIVEWLCSII